MLTPVALSTSAGELAGERGEQAGERVGTNCGGTVEKGLVRPGLVRIREAPTIPNTGASGPRLLVLAI
jgi:hypothetical protein